MRIEGQTYDEIAARLGVSKSSVSLWTRDLAHPPARADGVDARFEGLQRYFEAQRARSALERAQQVSAAAAMVGPVSDRELLIAGTVAYWAEGSKAKPWRRLDRVTFTNSDPGMIQLFQAFLRLMGVVDDQLRFRVAIHENADVDAATRFWADLLAVDPAVFQPASLKRHQPRTTRKNVGADYHGCLVINVLRSADLYRRIEGMWTAVVAESASGSTGTSSNLGGRSRVV